MNVHGYVPQTILEIVKKNKVYSSDHYSVLPSVIKHENELYYYIHYKVTDRYLIIRRDGLIPSLKTIDPVIDLAAFFVAASFSFNHYGDKWIKEKTIQNYRRIKKLLSTLEEGLQNCLTSDQMDLLHEFYYTAQTVIDWQKKLEKVVEEGKKRMIKITNDIATFKDKEYLHQLQKELGRCVYEQNQVQLNTDQNRQRLITIIWRKIPTFNLRLWLAYFELKKHHQKMLDRSKMDAEEVQDTEALKRRIKGEWDPDSSYVLQEIKSRVINPR